MSCLSLELLSHLANSGFNFLAFYPLGNVPRLELNHHHYKDLPLFTYSSVCQTLIPVYLCQICSHPIEIDPSPNHILFLGVAILHL